MKKIVSLLLVLTMVLSFTSVFAEDYEPKYEIISKTVNVDGKDYEAKLLLAVYDGWADVYVQIAPLARAFGYEVTYIEKTDSVTFEKDGSFLELSIAEKTDVTNDEYIDTICYEDRTYVSYNAVDRLLEEFNVVANGWFYDESENYAFYTNDGLKEKYKDSFDAYEKLVSYVSKGNFAETETFDLKLNYDNETFGVSVKGGAELNGKSVYDNGAFQAEFELSTSGLMNLIELFSQGDQVFDGDEKLNTDDKMTVSVIFDGKDLYLKGDFAEFMVSQEIPYFLDEEGWEDELKYTEEVKNGWIKLDSEGVPISYNEMLTAEGLVASIADSDMDYETKTNVLDVLKYLFEYVNLSLKEDDNGINYKIAIDKEFAELASKLVGAELPEFSGDYEFVVEETYNNDLTGESLVKGSIQFDEVVLNEYGIDSGKLLVELTSKATRTPIEKAVKTPEKFTTISEFVEKMNEFNDKYYGD